MSVYPTDLRRSVWRPQWHWRRHDRSSSNRPTRLAWASTGTKDPKASDTLYVKALSSQPSGLRAFGALGLGYKRSNLVDAELVKAVHC